MSVIVALRCKDALVIASDSRMTDEAQFRDDTEKVFVLHAKTHSLIAAAAGHADESSVILSQFSKRILGKKMTADDDAARQLQEAIFEYKRRVARVKYGCTLKTVDNKFLIEGIKSDFVLAYFFKGSPFIFSTSLQSVVPIARKVSYWSLGIGETVANYLLRQVDVANMGSQQAMFTAIAVIKEVKECVPGCGGETQLAVVSRGNTPKKLTSEAVREREAMAISIQKMIKERQEILKSSIESADTHYQSLIGEGEGGFAAIED
jgi:20S proteasome alpha/beta subunit